MELILDMVHHNPGEAPFDTRFLDPMHLAAHGYNGQVFKHLNCIARFDSLGYDCFDTEDARRWLREMTARIEQQIDDAKAAGLLVLFHVDLFVLPRVLVETERQAICDERTGRISLRRPRTLELHRIMLNELFDRYPQIDGLILRVGETYLHDTPHHTGNGAIAWDFESGDPSPEQEEYVELIEFLRAELCEKRDRYVLFRTWDVFPDRFHADLDYYRAVTDRIEPHEKLLFSIKHTKLDFFRRVMVNPCLGKGRHGQVVEVQSQREYEGKGAHPNYVMSGVIDGFEENHETIGLKDLAGSPLIRGVYGWSRGGGWYGPYLANEFWCEMNACVLGRWAAQPHRPEADVCNEFVRQRVQADRENADRIRRIGLLGAEGVLRGRYCQAYDRLLEERDVPVNLWMRDENLGGMDQLKCVLDTLAERGELDVALAEKADAVRTWQQAVEFADAVDLPDAEHIRASTRYGLHLYRIVEAGWRALAAGHYRTGDLAAAIGDYDEAWTDYRRLLKSSDHAATGYRGQYGSHPGQPPAPGLDDSIAALRQDPG